MHNLVGYTSVCRLVLYAMCVSEVGPYVLHRTRNALTLVNTNVRALRVLYTRNTQILFTRSAKAFFLKKDYYCISPKFQKKC